LTLGNLAMRDSLNFILRVACFLSCEGIGLIGSLARRALTHMKTTKKTLLLSLDYLSNVTGLKYNLSCQCAGNGKGYSVMHDGSHVLTFGHVPAATLEACIAAYVKGYLKGEGK
jgi:hypothetical protein